MQEAKIILPVLDNNGRDIMHLHADLRGDLRRRYGGLTAMRGEGMYIHRIKGTMKEDVIIYTAAGEGSLRDLAIFYGKRAGQDSVYFVDFDGIARIEACDGK